MLRVRSLVFFFAMLSLFFVTPAMAQKPIVPEEIPGVETVGVDTVKALIGSGAAAFDVRPARALAKGTIPETGHLLYDDSKSKKAVNYDSSQDKFDVAKLPADKTAPVVLYCQGDTCWRSYKASIAAREAGYTNIKWFRGGTPEWQGQGFELVKK